MKKITAIVLTILFLTGCSSGVSQAEYDRVVSERDALVPQAVESGKAIISGNDKGYIEAPITIFHTPASENMLGDILMYMDGTVEGVDSLPNDDTLRYVTISTVHGNLSLYTSFSLFNKELESLNAGDKIRVYFSYGGFSEVLNTGSGSYIWSKPTTSDKEPPDIWWSVTAERIIDADNTQNSEQSSSGQSVTMGQRNALAKAKEYLSVTAFSHRGLVEQLEYEGYSRAEATYGADNCGANWNEQAAKKAKEYLDIMAFSRSGLIEQLEYDGFTNSQAVYGVEANGY